jgi:hypothetical protein
MHNAPSMISPSFNNWLLLKIYDLLRSATDFYKCIVKARFLSTRKLEGMYCVFLKFTVDHSCRIRKRQSREIWKRLGTTLRSETIKKINDFIWWKVNRGNISLPTKFNRQEQSLHIRSYSTIKFVDHALCWKDTNLNYYLF